jgi:hypothetical protein
VIKKRIKEKGKEGREHNNTEGQGWQTEKERKREKKSEVIWYGKRSREWEEGKSWNIQRKKGKIERWSGR